MSALATVTYAPVYNVTQHGLSQIRPWVTRVMSVSALCGGVSAYAGVRPSPPALVCFPTVGHRSYLFLCCNSVAILVFSILVCLFVTFHLFSGVGIHRNYFRSDLVNHNSSTPPAVRPFVGRGATGFPGRSCGCFDGVFRLPLRHAALVPSLGPRLPSPLLPSVVGFLCRGLVHSMRKLSIARSLYDLRTEWCRRHGPAVQWP
jgi:hypothetical protein